LNYKDPTLLGKILLRIRELRLNYYISSDKCATVLTYWQGTWIPYHEVAMVDKRMGIV
jgi:hypothetical protein